jgi:ribokinase
MKDFDLITIGDSSIDLYMKVGDDSGMTENAQGSELPRVCFFHGSKIPVESFKTSIAGNAVNVAVGTTLLGLKAAVYTEIGDDTNADRIINELNKVGVETKFCHKEKGTETDLHSIIVFGGERTIFSYHGKRHYEIPAWGKPKFIYYTSMGAGFKDFQMKMVSYVKKVSHSIIAFNPGTMQMKAGVDAMREILSHVDILFVNKEEAERLTDQTVNATADELHMELHKLGPHMTVITNGSDGASASDGQHVVVQKAFSDERPVVDKTGAGDAFSSGFLAAIFWGKPMEEALKWGAINSGHAIKVVGAIHGLCDKKQIERYL